MNTEQELKTIARLHKLVEIPGVVEIPEDNGCHFAIGEWHVHFNKGAFAVWQEIGDDIIVSEVMVTPVLARRSSLYVVEALDKIAHVRDMEEAPGSPEYVFLSHIRGIIKDFWAGHHGPDFADPKDS